MLRKSLLAVAVLMLPPLLGAVSAGDKKKDEKADRPHMSFGTVVKEDAANHTITVKTRGRDGKEQEKTIDLKDVKLLGEDGKENKEGDFLKNLKEGEHVLITEREGKVVSVRDLPEGPRMSMGTVVREDAAKHTITVKLRGRDGKEQEKTIDLKGIKLIGADGKEHTEGDFLKDLKEGEHVLIARQEGKVISVRDLPHRPHVTHGTVVKTDTGKDSIAVKVKARDGKEQDKTIELKGVKLIGKDNKVAKLTDFAAGDHVLLVEREGKLEAVRELPPMPHMVLGTIVKEDAAGHAITVKVKGRDGKEQDRTITLKGIKLIGEDGKETKEEVFLKDLNEGEHILIIEQEGLVVSVRDLPGRRKRDNKKDDK